jgi:hypothetical protein
MKSRLFLPLGIVLLLGSVPRVRGASDPLPRSTPEAEGVSSRAIVDFVQAADKTVGRSQVVWRPYRSATHYD